MAAEIERRGAVPHIVGNGRPEFGRMFVEDLSLTIDVRSDPSQKLQDDLQLVRSTVSVLHPRAGLNFIRSFVRGKGYVGPIRGDTTQQGGLFVIDPGGKLRYSHRDAIAGDDEPFEEAIASLGA